MSVILATIVQFAVVATFLYLNHVVNKSFENKLGITDSERSKLFLSWSGLLVFGVMMGASIATLLCVTNRAITLVITLSIAYPLNFFVTWQRLKVLRRNLPQSQ